MVAFWSPARLAEALRADALSERDKLQLMVASAIFGEIFGSLGIIYTWRAAPILLPPAVLGLTVSLIGLYSSFRANQRGDGVRFVERLVGLGFPVGARVLTAFYGGFWLLTGITSGHWGLPNTPPGWMQWALTYLLATTVMWLSMRKYMGRAARTAAA